MVSKYKKRPSVQGKVDVLEASKGAPRLKDLALVIEFAQEVVRVHDDSRLVQMDRTTFIKTLQHQDGDYRLRYSAPNP